MTTAKQLIVKNPRSIPAGIPILTTKEGTGEKEWFEGDVWKRPSSMKADAEKSWRDRGFLEEAD